MLNNDVLRSLRYLLDLPDAHLAELAAPFGEQVEADLLEAYLKKEDEDGFQACPDRYLAPLSNNMILKKLRVAFELKEEDLHAILDSVDFPVSKPELSALFRKPGHSNYRTCGDQLLRNFLKGLTLRVRG